MENYNPAHAKTIEIEPDKKGSLWPWALILGLGLGFGAGTWVAYGITARTVEDLRLAERQAVEKMETALDFTRLIKPDTIQAAQALFACRTGGHTAFVCEAAKLEAERRELPIVNQPAFEDTKDAQDLAWKGAQ
jgi:hypothetical protein